MTEQPSPSPSPSTGPATAAPNPISEGFGRLDRSSQVVVGAGAVAALTAIVGTALGTWPFEYAGLVLLLAAIAGAALAWLQASRRLPVLPVRGGDLMLVAAGIVAALGVLALLTILGDLDQLDEEYGGVLGVVASAVLAAAGVAMVAGTLRLAAPADAGGASRTSPRRGIMIGLAGAAIALIGWVANLTIGVWEFHASVVAVSLIVIGAVMLRSAGGSAEGSTPLRASWIAVVASAAALLILVDHYGPVSRIADRGLFATEDWLAFAAYAVGVVALLGGSILRAADERVPGAAAAAEPAPATADPGA